MQKGAVRDERKVDRFGSPFLIRFSLLSLFEKYVYLERFSVFTMGIATNDGCGA